MDNVITLPRLKVRPGTEADRAALIVMVGSIWRETYLRPFQNGVGEEHRCGLTGEALTDDDSRRICQEHEERRSA